MKHAGDNENCIQEGRISVDPLILKLIVFWKTETRQPFHTSVDSYGYSILHVIVFTQIHRGNKQLQIEFISAIDMKG